MPGRCCSCMKQGRCVRCSCARLGRNCVDCWPSLSSPSRCQNLPGEPVRTLTQVASDSERRDDSTFSSVAQSPTSTNPPNPVHPVHLGIRSRKPTLKRVPRASRHLVASKLSSLLDKTVSQNDILAWNDLLGFAHRYLFTPTRGGHRRSLTSLLNKRFREEIVEEEIPDQPSRRSQTSSISPSYLLSKISSKLDDGDFRGAVRLSCSENTFAPMNEDTTSALKEKHPPPPADCHLPPPPDRSVLAHFTQEDIAKAMSSYPNGSAGGPDGLRPQHLKDLISPSAEKGGKDLLSSLTDFINTVGKGNVPLAVRPFFFGANLIALNKKGGGGVRPIAVGNTLRRLVAKCFSS